MILTLMVSTPSLCSRTLSSVACQATIDCEITTRCNLIMNRADPTMLRYMRFHIDKVDPNRGPRYKLAKELAQELFNNCKEAVNGGPLYKDGGSLYSPSFLLR